MEENKNGIKNVVKKCMENEIFNAIFLEELAEVKMCNRDRMC